MRDAKIVKLFKNKGDQSDYNNYRVLGLARKDRLPTTTLHLDRSIYDDLKSFIKRYK